MKLAQLLPEAFVCAEPQETQRAFLPFFDSVYFCSFRAFFFFSCGDRFGLRSEEDIVLQLTLISNAQSSLPTKTMKAEQQLK